MSASLYIVPKPLEGRSLSDSLRYTFAKRFMDSDGSMSGEFTLDRSHIGYLEGLLDAISDRRITDDIKRLLKLIEQDGDVNLEIRH